MMNCLLDRVENTVGKGENVCYLTEKVDSRCIVPHLSGEVFFFEAMPCKKGF